MIVQRRWSALLIAWFVGVVLLSSCGPEALPSVDTVSHGQVQPPPNRQPVATNLVVSPTPTLPAPAPSVLLTATLSLAQPISAVTAPVASPIVASLAITDPAKVDIFQIAEEFTAAGDDAFPIQVTLGEGDAAMQIRASKPELISLPCFPRQPAPQGRDYLCQLGGGLDGEVWIATWGQGLKRLVTGQAMGGAVWSNDGKRIAFATLAGQDEAGNVPLKVLDLESNQETVVGMMSSPYQMAFTPSDELIYMVDNAFQVVAIPRELAKGVSLVKTIPMANIPDNQSYLSSAAAWFKVSPAGDKVAVMREWGGAIGQLSVLDVTSGQETVIEEQVRNSAYSLANIFGWSPDGSALAYLTMVEEGSMQEGSIISLSELWLTDRNGANRHRIWRSEQPFMDYTDLDWVSNGKALLVTAAVEAGSDLAQIVSVTDGALHDLFQGGKGMIPVEIRSGVISILMQGVWSPAPAYMTAVITFQ